MAKNAGEITLTLLTKISLWDAIKLRIAGVEYVREVLRRALENAEKDTHR